MSWEKKLHGHVRAVEGALRHPDGSPDIAAYGRIAHHQRDAAVVAAVQDTARSLRAMWSSIWRVFGWGPWAGRGASDRMRPSEAKSVFQLSGHRFASRKRVKPKNLEPRSDFMERERSRPPRSGNGSS